MHYLIENPLFGLVLSLLAFEIGCFIYKKFKAPIFNPLLIAVTLIIVFLLITDISFDTYNEGAHFINLFLGPSTVVLAVPLYKQLKLLKENFLPIITGVFIGCIFGIISILLLSYLLNLDMTIIKSLAAKSVTTPIGIEITKELGGITSITIAAIIISGIIGAVMGPLVCRIFKIQDKIAVGISLGTAAHAIGTTKAMELGEVEGAMSSLSMGLSGIITVFLAPLLIKIIWLFL
ncbi:LrgB family protein [Clostridium polynesiense]|uniref:LrgB family protein n=1 Tax=Clostridium polynesiense TaxID=1325933 RepID=UPI00058E7E4E|nr:LrgB family protein [Clostridium polynesiense]